MVLIVVVINTVSYFNSKNDTFDLLNEIQVKNMTDANALYDFYGNTKRMAIESLAEQFSTNLNMPTEEIMHILKLAAKTSGFELVYIGFEDSGKNYQSDGEILDLSKGYDTKNRGWYKEAKAAGGFITTDPYKSITTGEMGITYAIPVYANGKFIGVVGGDYNLKTFSKDVLAIGDSQSSYAAVYDKEGMIIFHEDEGRMLTKNDLSVNIANAVKSNPSLIDLTKEKTLFYAKDGNGKTQVVTCNQALNPKYMVCSITNESVYTTAVNKVLFQQVIIAFIAIIIALILVRFAIIKNLKPIAVITTGLNSFFDFINHKTKDSAMIDVKSNDELGAMAKTINENITKTKNALEQDAKAVEQSVETAKEIESGNLMVRITATPANPQLIELKNVLNDMLNVLEQKVGSNMNEINRVFDSYKALDFTTEVKNAKGGVEVTTNVLGQEIVAMLRQSSEFASLLADESGKLQSAVKNLTD
ncbi:methyl-accepting chemotaxis protein, partial [Campylobacter sp. P255]|uniref:cache domain-containing protein n=1 Tax=Campylobacter sp. P255 TaxID=1979368 RepID=UPI000EA9F970